jgi:hypothetical protein
MSNCGFTFFTLIVIGSKRKYDRPASQMDSLFLVLQREARMRRYKEKVTFKLIYM